MIKVNPEKLYQKAIDKWGTSLQITMVFEEMSELQKALTKHIRGKTNHDNISEEIADNLIMLEQLQVMFNNRDQVKAWKIKKLERLKQMLNK